MAVQALLGVCCALFALLVLPLADGSAGMPTLIDRKTAPAVPLYLSSCTQLEGGVIQLRYTLANPA